MEKMKMQSENLVAANIDKIKALFPNCVTEGYDDNGKLTKLVDFDLLKQELSNEIVDGNDERYTLNWPGKKQAILTANSPINATLRPCKEESVDFDNTKNLYIEGDNLDVLKLLRETYLGKIKMIYIDPPYNTGKDFVYEDNFATSAEDYLQTSKSYDDQGNRLFQNNDSNGRFHSSWLTMMYSRLKIAKDLLTDDGAVFISIDDNEQVNLRKLCDEVFGENNFVCNIPRMTSAQRPSQEKYVSIQHDYIVVYVKNNSESNNFARTVKRTGLENIKKDSIGLFFDGDTSPILASSTQGYSKGGDYDFEYEGIVYKPIANDGTRRRWLWTIDRMKAAADLGILVPTKNGLRVKNYIDKEFQVKTNIMVEKDPNLILASYDLINAKFANNHGTSMLNSMGIKFDFSKPVELLIELLRLTNSNDFLVLDFFSGSATTAQAVMQLNADDGGNRKFLMVQIPEECDKNSEVYKAGYKNICEIGKERIRRAGKKIKEEIEKSTLIYGKDAKKPLESTAETKQALQMALDSIDDNKNFEEMADKKVPDIGFRVLKLDSSCMKDVYYNPADLSQDLLAGLEDNIKEDRTPEDLLFQVMLDMGVMLSSDIKTLDIQGKKVFNVSDGNLICCFDKNLTEEVVKEIAKMQPLYAVFRDSSMATDSVNVNFDQIFKTYSPTTERKVL